MLNIRKNIFWFLIIIHLIELCCGELPNISCRNLEPFKTKDNNCADFTKICVKTTDEDCLSFLDVCSQCPASNYSILIFQDITQLKAEKKDTDKKLLDITNELQNLKVNIKHTIENIHILSYVCIAIILLLLVVLILEIRFKLITKLLANRKTKRKYNLLESRKSIKQYDVSEKLSRIEVSISTAIDKKLNEILNNIKNISNPTRKKTKFYVTGIANPIELEIGKNINIVQVKRQICSEIQNCKPDHYKIMKLFLNGERINDNRYFTSLNLSEDDKINCEFDNNADPNEIVVIQLKGNVKLPKCIQIEKYRTISYLKNIIPKIENIQNRKIFINNEENENKLKEVDDSTTIQECRLHDDDVMRVISQKTENLEITSIFNEKILTKIKYSNVDLVYNIKKIVADNLQIDQNEFVLYLFNKKLNDDKFAFEYFTETDVPVKVCKFMNSNDLDIDDQPLVKGNFGEIFKSKIKENNMEILIKRYNLTITTQMEDNFHIFNELKKFQLTKSHPRFIQVLDLYKDDYFVYVAMENMEIGSLSMYLKKNPEISETCVSKWSIQILEGLKFLHQNEIIHRDLNPKSVLLDKDLSIKLSNFNLSKYSEFHKSQTYNVKYKQKSPNPLRYLAPETVINEVYSFSTDIWSFGAVLIRIVTNKKPYYWIENKKVRNEINENGSRDYKCSENVPVEIKKIIELCMKGNPNERVSIKKLSEEKFFQQAKNNKN